MKKTIFIIFAALMALSACDTIAPEDRFVQTEETQTEDRSVLLMDFTGWQCVNCPEAAQIANSLQRRYPENLIVVSMHPAGSAFTKEGTNDFASNQALEYLQAFGGSTASALPTGVVDMTEIDGDYMVDRQKWPTAVTSRLAMPTDFKISLTATENSCSYTVSPKSITDRNVNLLLWLVEDSIVSPQVTKDGTNPDYVHRHVFRKCLNGTDIWGESIADPNADYENTAFYELPQRVGDHFLVVAVLVDADTHEVLQATEARIGGSAVATNGMVTDNEGNPYSDGDTIDCYEIDSYTNEIKFEGYFNNLLDEDVELTVDEERDFDYDRYKVSFCIIVCRFDDAINPGHWGPYRIAAGGQQDFQAHVGIPSDQTEPVVLTTKYTFSDGHTSMNLIVRFHYSPE